MKVLTDEVIASFKDAARKLTGPKRRAFHAQVTLDYLEGIYLLTLSCESWVRGHPRRSTRETWMTPTASSASRRPI